MFEEKYARESLFGYKEVHNANWNGLELPDPHLMKLLMGRKRDRGIQLLDEMKSEVGRVISEIESRSVSANISESIVQKTVEYGIDLIQPAFRDEVRRSPEKLRKAALYGLNLGRLDSARIGENPPVALGAHVRALTELCEKSFFDDGDDMTPTRAACINIAQSAFYTTRRFEFPLV